MLLTPSAISVMASGGFLQGDVLTQTTEGSGLAGAGKANAGNQLPVIIGQMVNVILSVLGLILLVYLLYGGYLWMTSGGDSEGVKKAKTMITNAVIGLVIITLSVVITSYVVSRLGSAIK